MATKIMYLSLRFSRFNDKDLIQLITQASALTEKHQKLMQKPAVASIFVVLNKNVSTESLQNLSNFFFLNISSGRNIWINKEHQSTLLIHQQKKPVVKCKTK